MSKKTFFTFISFFIFFLAIVPLSQSFIFQNSKMGKLEINKEVNIDFIKEKKNEHFLIFFGYYGCTAVCTPILYELNEVYEHKDINDYKEKIDVYFVNLLPHIKESDVKLFAQAFNKNFKGVYLNNEQLMKIDRNFNLYFTASLLDKNEIDHTAHVYLISKKKNSYILKNSYTTTPLNKELLIKDIKEKLYNTSK